MLPIKQNYYQLLGVAYTATNEEIIAKYQQLLAKIERYNGELSLNSYAYKLDLFQALKVLLDPQLRQHYDRSLVFDQLDKAEAVTSADGACLVGVFEEQSSPAPKPPHYSSDKVAKAYQGFSTNTDAKNQREYERLPIDGDLILNHQQIAKFIDITPKGAQIELHQSLEDVEQLCINSKLLTGQGNLRFIKVNKGDTILAGVEFVEVQFHPNIFVNVYI